MRYFLQVAHSDDDDCLAFIQVSEDLEARIKRYTKMAKKLQPESIYCLEFFNYDVRFLGPYSSVDPALKDIIEKAMEGGYDEVKLTDEQVKALETLKSVGDKTTTMKVHTDGEVSWTDDIYYTESIPLG